MMNDLPVIENGVVDADGVADDFQDVDIAQIVGAVSHGGFDGAEPAGVGGFGVSEAAGRFLIGGLPLFEHSPFPTGVIAPDFVGFVDLASLATFVLHGVYGSGLVKESQGVRFDLTFIWITVIVFLQ